MAFEKHTLSHAKPNNNNILSYLHSFLVSVYWIIFGPVDRTHLSLISSEYSV